MNDYRNNMTTVCPNCATSYEAAPPNGSRQTCPNCGGTTKGQDPIPWTNVARVANLAEAGFLTDELIGQGIEARIHQLDDFNALNDRWTSLYLIQVPSESAGEAAGQIERHRNDDLRNQEDDQSQLLSRSTQIMDPRFWRPIALLIVTSTASFII